MTRTGAAAETWARGQITHPTPGQVVTGATSWHRLCKAFVRGCFAVPSDGTTTAGSAWDRAHFKHRESDPDKIPDHVPVFWELPTVEDHVAFSSTGPGRCISTDYPANTGLVREASIADITRDWGGQLLGWTEDIDGVRIWTPPTPEPEPEPEDPPKTRVQLARGLTWDAILLLDKAIADGRGEAVELFRAQLRRDLARAPKK